MRWIFFLLVLLSSSEASARRENCTLYEDKKYCMDDRFRAGMRKTWALEPLESLIAQRVEVRRALIFAGYSGPKPALSFIRPPGDSPRIEIAVPWGRGDRWRPYRLKWTIAIDEKTWAEAAALPFPGTEDEITALASMQAVPATGDAEEDLSEIIVCTDGHAVLTEMIGRDRPKAALTLRRAIESTGCHQAPMDYLDDLSRIAAKAIPGCIDYARTIHGASLEVAPQFVLRGCSVLENFGVQGVAVLRAFGSEGRNRLPALSPDFQALQGKIQISAAEWNRLFVSEEWDHWFPWKLYAAGPNRLNALTIISRNNPARKSSEREGKRRQHAQASLLLEINGEQVLLLSATLGKFY